VALDWELTEIEDLLHELARERRDDDDRSDHAPTRAPIERKQRRHLRIV
jgi:hypothetical protein